MSLEEKMERCKRCLASNRHLAFVSLLGLVIGVGVCALSSRESFAFLAGSFVLIVNAMALVTSVCGCVCAKNEIERVEFRISEQKKC